MPAVGTHPLITIIILFIVFFTIFFLLIYAALRYVDNRKEGKEKLSEEELTSQSEIPSYPKVKTCPNCGTMMPGIASFCPECGAQQVSARVQK
jgi:hypothetical protein